MSEQLTITDLKRNFHLMSVSENAAYYGVVAAVVDYKADEGKADSGYYLVAGLGKFPEYENPKDIEDRQQRNILLFYPKEFAMKLNKDNLQYAIEELYNYCQRAEMIECLYNEYNCQIPDVLRCNEVTLLYRLNKGWNNEEYDVFLRRSHKNEMDAFFKEEKKAEKNKSTKKYHDFYRSDRYDSNKSYHQNLFQMTTKGKEQNISMDLLRETGNDLITIEIDEDICLKFKEALKNFPEVTYTIGKLQTYDEGKIKFHKGEKDPFEGENIHSEWRDLTFKKVDEPIIIGQLRRLQWEDKAIPRSYLRGDIVAKNISSNNIHNFVSLANANNLKFAIDVKGEFIKPAVNQTPVLFYRNKLHVYNSIMDRINDEKVKYHSIEESNLPYLTSAINKAEDKKVLQSIGTFGKSKSAEIQL